MFVFVEDKATLPASVVGSGRASSVDEESAVNTVEEVLAFIGAEGKSVSLKVSGKEMELPSGWKLAVDLTYFTMLAKGRLSLEADGKSYFVPILYLMNGYQPVTDGVRVYAQANGGYFEVGSNEAFAEYLSEALVGVSNVTTVEILAAVLPNAEPPYSVGEYEEVQSASVESAVMKVDVSVVPPPELEEIDAEDATIKRSTVRAAVIGGSGLAAAALLTALLKSKL